MNALEVSTHDRTSSERIPLYFRRWEGNGTWEALNTTFREQVREQSGRNRQPSAGSIDSQSVKTAGAGQESGFDGAKKVKGRKRTILVDTMGLLLGATVHSAHRSDHAGYCWELGLRQFGVACS